MADTHRVDRTDRHLQFQSPYEGGRVSIQYEGGGGAGGYGGRGGGYGAEGYKSMMPERGPSSTQKGKEMGQHVQNKAQEAKQYDISKTHDTTTKGHETTQRTAAA
ncbi:hypothetical protein YC2023_077227 [Brassica napus]